MKSKKNYMKKKLDGIKRNSMAKGIFLISSGSLLAQSLSYIFSPIITRIFSPDQYGIMSVLVSVISILSFSSLRYEMAIPIEKNEKKAINLLMLSIIILIVFSVLLTFSIYFFGAPLLLLLNAEQLIDYKIFIIIGVFFVGLKEILWQWLYRINAYKLLTIAKIEQNFIGNVFKVIAGLTGMGVSGLLFGQILKNSFSFISVGLKIIKNNTFRIAEINKKDIIWNFKRYKNYPLFQTPSSFLAVLKNQLPVFSLAIYGTQVVGLYGLANTIIKIPMNLFGQSVRNVFYAEAAKIGKENPVKLKLLTKQIFNKMVLIGLIPFLLLAFVGPILFSFVFGPEWQEAGIYVRYLSIGVYGDFIFSPVSRIYEIFDKQKIKLFIDIFGLLLVFSSFSIAKMISNEPHIAILLYSISMFLYYGVSYYLSQRIISKNI